jgi:hypothetical protein
MIVGVKLPAVCVAGAIVMGVLQESTVTVPAVPGLEEGKGVGDDDTVGVGVGIGVGVGVGVCEGVMVGAGV